MNKAIFFAAALAITPLPAMGQQAQQSQDPSQDRQSTYSERDRDNERGGGEDLLDRLSRSDLRDRLSTAFSASKAHAERKSNGSAVTSRPAAAAWQAAWTLTPTS